MRFSFMLTEKADFPVATLCRVLNVSRSGFYAWGLREESARSRQDRALGVKMKAIHVENREAYGVPRMHRALRGRGHRIGKKRVARLMRHHGLGPKRRKKFQTTTDSRHSLPVAKNLVDRQFNVEEPNKVWVSDITYIWTRAGWLYLCVVLDLFSRRVVGWAAGPSIDAGLAQRALLMALQRRPAKPGLVFHSDRGSQYAANAFRELLDEHGLVASMSRKGNCWDNAVAESFFGSLKVELVHGVGFTTREATLRALFDYIELFYNRRRLHSALGYMSPIDYEAAVALQRRVA